MTVEQDHTIKHFSIISIFPEIFSLFRDYGVLSRAFRSHIIRLRLVNPRDYATDSLADTDDANPNLNSNLNANIDDKPFGGGPGMLMKAEPLLAAISEARKLTPEPYIIVYLSPNGEVFSQSKARKFVGNTENRDRNIIFICGRYEGIDQRIIESEVDELWSIGDYVLTGGNCRLW